MPRMPASLSGLAGQLGISGDQDPTATPAFYSLLASSESIRREVLFTTVPSEGGSARVPVWRALGIERCDSTCLLRLGIPKLEGAVSVAVDRQTGTFAVVAILRDPSSAAGLVDAYVAAMERYNRQVRRSQARASREFLESRVDAVDGQVRADEDQLESFYQSNSAWQMSPRQRMAEGRLRRRIDARVELLANLKRQLEASRLDEISATPLLNVIDAATPPLRKHAPRGLLIVVAAVATGAFTGLAIGLLRARAPV
jgi:uncharacterized protein involved in exopolysaccharide biosynthesis